MNAGENRQPELDGVRGIACLLVLFDHCFVSLLKPGTFHGAWRLRQTLEPFCFGGVDLFFVLSGFLIGGILFDHKGASNYFRVFWSRRVARIMPVYYLVLASFLVIVALRRFVHVPWLTGPLFGHTMPFWTYATFTQNIAMAVDRGEGGARWLASTWSLGVEEQFYLLLPPLVYLLSRRAIVRIACIGMVAAILVRAIVWRATGTWFPGQFLLVGRMDPLMAGVLAAVIVRHKPALAWLQHRMRLFDAAACVFVLALAINIPTTAQMYGPRHFGLLLASLDFSVRSLLFGYVILRIQLVPERSLYRRILAAAPLTAMGLISYSLYMYHQPVGVLVHGVLFGDAPRLDSFARLFASFAVMVISTILATFSTLYFELPILRAARRRIRYAGNTSGTLPQAGGHFAGPVRSLATSPTAGDN